jgi:hypothetical protein
LKILPKKKTTVVSYPLIPHLYEMVHYSVRAFQYVINSVCSSSNQISLKWGTYFNLTSKIV